MVYEKNNSQDYIDNNMCIIDSKLIEIDNIIKNISKNGKELDLINDIKKLINFKIKNKLHLFFILTNFV